MQLVADGISYVLIADFLLFYAPFFSSMADTEEELLLAGGDADANMDHIDEEKLLADEDPNLWVSFHSVMQSTSALSIFSILNEPMQAYENSCYNAKSR